MKYDAVLKKGEVYEDDEFENYDKESDENDSLLSDMPTLSEASDPHAGLQNELPKNVEINDPDEWEDVEIDDFEED